MLSFVKTMQITLNQALFGVVLPPDASIFFGGMVEIVSFDPVDITDQLTDVFDLTSDHVPFSINFEAMGYETSS